MKRGRRSIERRGSSNPARGIASVRNSRTAIGAAVVAAALLLTFAAFGSAVSGAFVSDDTNCIVENDHVSGPLDVAAIFSTFSWWSSGRADSPGYRPLVTLSFALNHAAAGLQPFAYHVTNFALHALVVGLLFALGVALGTGTAGAAVGALLFCLMPIHSEAVVWIVGRAELGAAIGFLLTVWLVVQYRRSGSVLPLAACAATLLLGMLCKENAVTALAAPALLGLVMPATSPPAAPGLAATWWSRRRRDAIATAVLVAATAAYVAIRLAAGGSMSSGQAESPLDNPLVLLGFPGRWLGALSVLGRYLWLTVAGHPLSVDYSFDALGIHEGFAGDRFAVLAAVSLAALGLWGWRTRKRTPAIAFGLLMAAAAYSIVSNTVVLIGTIAGERLFYLPSAGLCLAAGAALAPLLEVPSRRRTTAAVMLGLVCAAWLTIDRQRSTQWRDAISLFSAAVETAPRSARAHVELASAYGQAGQINKAKPHFEAALAIKPDYATAAYNYGNAMARAGRFDEAVTNYRRAVVIDSHMVRAWHNLALVYRIQGKTDAWLETLATTVQKAPQSPELRLEYAEALLNLNRNQEAVAAYDEAIRSGYGTAIAYFNRGVAKHRLGGCQAALEDYRSAASRPGAPPDALRAVQGCLLELGRSE